MEAIKIIRGTYVQPQDIVMLKANINYTEFHFENGEVIIISKTLKSFQNTFHLHGFVRINKSDMINIQFLTATRSQYSYVTLTNNIELSVSRRRRKDLKSFVYDQKRSTEPIKPSRTFSKIAQKPTMISPIRICTHPITLQP